MPGKGGGTTPNRNAARRNGKAWKQNPGVKDGAHPGRTKDGYTPAALARRAARRTGPGLSAVSR